MSTASGFAEALSRNFLLRPQYIHVSYTLGFLREFQIHFGVVLYFFFFYIVLLKEEFDNHRKRDVCYLTCTGDSHEQFT